MKLSFKPILFLMAGVFILTSCEKVENKVVLLGGKAPELSASLPVNSTITLDKRLKDKTAITFNWTNPDYKFNTGVSSQNVRYTLQFDEPGQKFSSPALREKSFSSSLSSDMTHDELNKMLLSMGYPFEVENAFEVRLKSALEGGSAAFYSNALTFNAIPYIDVAVPLPPTDDLWIVGDATPGGWDNPTTQKLTRTGLTTWEITIDLVGGGHFLIIPENGQWKKYSVADNSLPDLWKGGSFGLELSDDFPAPSTAGTYKIKLDFAKGSFLIIPQ